MEQVEAGSQLSLRCFECAGFTSWTVRAPGGRGAGLLAAPDPMVPFDHTKTPGLYPAPASAPVQRIGRPHAMHWAALAAAACSRGGSLVFRDSCCKATSGTSQQLQQGACQPSSRERAALLQPASCCHSCGPQPREILEDQVSRKWKPIFLEFGALRAQFRKESNTRHYNVFFMRLSRCQGSFALIHAMVLESRGLRCIAAAQSAERLE